MQNSESTVLTAVIFLPALAALLISFFPRGWDQIAKFTSLVATLVVFFITLAMWLGKTSAGFVTGAGDMQHLVAFDWIPTFNMHYTLGIDGISFPLVLLTSFLSVLAMGASWNINKHVKAYCILYLLLETGMLGVFVSLDFILFYVFWEVMLLPMYFLIGVWGGPRREYAAIKFFLYTLLGSVLMLIAILILYFNSDVTKLTQSDRYSTGVLNPFLSAEALNADVPTAEQVAAADAAMTKQIAEGLRSPHTFNILALQRIGQTTEQFSGILLWNHSIQWWCFILLFIGFAIKVPSVPLHTWLPDAHVEAPTPISMILAGVLLKMGGYGIIRICYPICPHAAFDLAYVVCTIGVVSMVYGAFAALAQKDFKRMVAYSSVSHMGYVVLGLGVWSLGMWNPTNFSSDYWKMGVNGAMFQMIAHGISSAGMFLMVGIIYDRVHHRNLDEFGGLFARMPVYSGLAIVLFFAGLGLPGLCGFWGEVAVTLSAWNFSKVLAIISASVVILTAGYILWAIQRVYLGPEYKGPHGDHIHPITARELSIAAPLVALAILFGVYPEIIFGMMKPSVNELVNKLAATTPPVRDLDDAPLFQPAQGSPKGGRRTVEAPAVTPSAEPSAATTSPASTAPAATPAVVDDEAQTVATPVLSAANAASGGN